MSIPAKIRKQLNADPFMQTCVLKRLGIEHPCNGLEFHHVWTYAGKQIQEVFAIVPACQHSNSKLFEQRYRHVFQWVSLHRATKKELARYPKKKWDLRFECLRWVCGHLDLSIISDPNNNDKYF